jgi:hypothetical protein
MSTAAPGPTFSHPQAPLEARGTSDTRHGLDGVKTTLHSEEGEGRSRYVVVVVVME